MAENDHVFALAQGVDPFSLRCRMLAGGRYRQKPKQCIQQGQSNDRHRLLPMARSARNKPTHKAHRQLRPSPDELWQVVDETGGIWRKPRAKKPRAKK